jgi:hypothetical protein
MFGLKYAAGAIPSKILKGKWNLFKQMTIHEKENMRITRPTYFVKSGITQK